MISKTINNLQAKDELIKLFTGSAGLSGKFVSIDDTYVSVLDMARAPSLQHSMSLFNTTFDSSYSCNYGNDCPKIQSEHQKNVTWDSFALTSRHIKSTVQGCLIDFFEDPDKENKKHCRNCSSRMTMHRRIISTPLILMVKFPNTLSRASAPTCLQDTLQFQGSDYILRAAAYGNGSHFITRYQTSQGHIYDYDGMQRYGSDFPITRRAMCVKRAESNDNIWFTGRISNSKRDFYIVNQCMYVKVV